MVPLSREISDGSVDCLEQLERDNRNLIMRLQAEEMSQIDLKRDLQALETSNNSLQEALAASKDEAQDLRAIVKGLQEEVESCTMLLMDHTMSGAMQTNSVIAGAARSSSDADSAFGRPGSLRSLEEELDEDHELDPDLVVPSTPSTTAGRSSDLDPAFGVESDVETSPMRPSTSRNSKGLDLVLEGSGVRLKSKGESLGAYDVTSRRVHHLFAFPLDVHRG